MRLALQLIFDEIVKFRAWKRIRNADPYVIRPGAFQQLTRGEDVFEFLAEIAQLNEETDANVFRGQAPARERNVFDRRALVHRVEDFLAAAFSADPHFPAIRVLQGARHGAADEIGARLDRERQGTSRRVQRGGKILNPVNTKTKNIVRKPYVVGTERALQIGHLGGHVGCSSLQISISPDRLGAPVAAK